MILYVGSFQVDPDRRAEFIAAAAPHVALSRADAGCLAFVIATDTDDPGLVHYLERWASREDLIAHGAATAARGSGGNPVPARNLGFELFEEGEPV